MHEHKNFKPPIIEIYREREEDNIGTTLTIPQMGEALLYHPPDQPDVLHLSRLHVEEDFRGNQIG